MRAARLISLVLLLQSRETMTAGELARELEVSERTVYRDVLALGAAGIPVYADRGRAGGYRLLGGYRTRLTGLSRDEADAIFLSGLPGPVGDMGLADAVAAARLKVLAALPPGMRDASTRVGQRFHLDVPGWFQPADPPPWLTELARAVWQDRTVELRYRRRDQVVTRTVQPYGLVLKNAVWYLVARVGGDYRSYRVDRVLGVIDAGRTGEGGTGEGGTGESGTFDRDGTFDLAGWWAERAAEFVRSMLREEITVRLSPAGMRTLRHAVGLPAAGEAAASAERPDGQGWVVTRLPVESVEVAYDQLLRLGPEVEVLAPAELRDRMAATAARLTCLYTPAPRPDHR